MFPLGSVLVPGMLLPLHVFEPRYRQMLAEVLDGDRCFGVVLIERGSEVGGGDVRSSVGTQARILDAARSDDGRFGVAALGEQRIRVESWLPDDPYPRAVVGAWPEADAEEGDSLADACEHAAGLIRSALARRVELGDLAAPVSFEVLPEPCPASHQLSALGPFGAADRQRLLSAPTVAERFDLLAALAAEDLELSELRLRQR